MSVREGKDIMVYVNTGTAEVPVWSPTAAATSHKITNSSETKQRKTKDNVALWGEKRVVGLSTAVSVEALSSDDAVVSYESLLAMWKTGEPVLLKYSATTEAAGDKYEEGLFIIASLDETAPADADATYSASFENTGEVSTKTKTA